jgi:hypothetical protein
LQRQVVLGSDSTQNFISSKPDQRRAIIEELLVPARACSALPVLHVF